MWSTGRLPHWVGRGQELAVLTAAIQDLRRGVGSVAWIEGEPGIGKSSLVTEAIAASAPGPDVSWAMADQLTQRLPLRVMVDCLRVRPGSPDPRRAHAADLLPGRQSSTPGGGDAAATGVEVLVTLVDELCAIAPMVLVIDDLQWADEASLMVWHQLAASISQLRLLLVATCRPTPRRLEVEQVRTAVVRRGGTLITLEPLPETDVADLVTAIVGVPPGDALRRLTAQSAGNPLYVRELSDALVRDRASPDRAARPGEQLPVSLAGVLADRLSSVSPQTAQVLRTAVLLGGGFTATDLAVVLRQPASALAPALQEAVAAGIVAGAGTELVFRHPLIRQALHESMPLALRTALHAEAARELAAAGADALSVAQQLSAASQQRGTWSRGWLIKMAPALATRAPELAVELLQRELDETSIGGEAWESLMTGLLWALLATGSYQEGVRQAGWALTVMTDSARRAETYWLLAHAQVSVGRGDNAIASIRQALAPADLPGKWQARMLALLSMLERDPSGVAAADSIARRALAAAEEAGDPSATAGALHDLWLTCSISRDHAAALDHIDRALRVIGDDPGHADLRAAGLDARTFTLHNLDEWAPAELALRDAREFAQRTGRPDRATWATAAVLRYWLGQWDDALAELGSDAADSPGLMYSFLRERWSALLTHGVTALIAGRRDQRDVADRELRQGLSLPMENVTDRENRDFLVAAHALAQEQRGEIGQAAQTLAVMLSRQGNEMTLIHQWLPDLVRLALAAGDGPLAQAAAQACQAEAAAEARPARAAAAARRCRGLVQDDPGPLLDAVAHYRTVGPAVELPAALEDLAVVLAGCGQEEEARAALNEAVSLYDGMQARWDIRRAESRLRALGIRRAPHSRRGPRATSGWAALTPTELKVAALVAQGGSTPDIARDLFLSRRTVQTYISRILAKLDAKSRVEIAAEALRQGA
ncbi:MAG TPA: AAA family ATPase [Trebonia sp.]|jgi:DNA-binding CsgD family transcriptional regulator|nr:AAA family ATPase [Trebonia sp.]